MRNMPMGVLLIRCPFYFIIHWYIAYHNGLKNVFQIDLSYGIFDFLTVPGKTCHDISPANTKAIAYSNFCKRIDIVNPGLVVLFGCFPDG